MTIINTSRGCTVRVILLASFCALGGPALASLAGPEGGIQVRRFPQNPVIRPEMLPGSDGDNINGPSLIHVPSWVTNRLGSYTDALLGSIL